MEYKSALDVFQQRKIDSSVESISHVEINPQSAIDQKGPYVYNIDADKDPILLQGVILKMKCKLAQTDGTALVAAETCSTVNNVLSSMFSKVEVMLGGKNVGYNHSLYPYRAMFEELLFADAAETDSRLMMQGFIKDTAGKVNVVNPAANPTNTGLKNRRDKFWAESESVTFMGGLHADIFRQPKCLVAGVPMRITLHRSPDNFVLVQHGATTYKITIESLTLVVPTVKTSEAMRRSMESMLLKDIQAVYNIDRCVMFTHFIPGGVTSHHIPSIFRRNLPHTIVFAMARNASRTPNRGVNPFNFEEFALQRMSLTRNNEAVAYQNGLKVDYGDGNVFTDGYYNYLKHTGCLTGSGRKPLIDFDEFKAGYNLFPFRLTPASDAETDTSLLNTGSLDLMLTFSAVTPAGLDLFVYSLFSDSISIDKDHNVTGGERG